jgi:hypothetical protein
MMKDLYEAYRAECAKHAPKHGAVLCEMTPREQELYDAWQEAILACTTWTDGETTWHILERWTDVDLEMWTCRIVSPKEPERTAPCFAVSVRDLAWPVDEP